MSSPDTSLHWVFCGKCRPPHAYPTNEIEVYLGDEFRTTLDKLGRGRGGASAKPGQSVIRAFLSGRPAETSSNSKTIDLTTLEPYRFQCPKEHEVDGNRGIQFPLAVVGPSGASKSHFLPAIIRELDDLRTLRSVGVSLRRGIYTPSTLGDNSAQIYVQKRVLERTSREEGVLGPYGYRLRVADLPEDLSLLLSDVAGEHVSDIMRLAGTAQFVLLSQGIIVLLDPNGFLLSQFDSGAVSDHDRLSAAIRAREGVRVIVDALSEGWSTKSKEMEIPFCFVIAKADAVRWDGFDWDAETGAVLRASNGGSDLRKALLESSDRVEAVFRSIGGEIVLEEIDDLLDRKWVRFVAASATSAMAKSSEEWTEEPVPNGVGLAILQILEMAGVFVEAHSVTPD